MKYLKASLLWVFTLAVAVGPPIVFVTFGKDYIWPDWPIIFIGFGVGLSFIYVAWVLIRYSSEEKGNWGKFWRNVWSRVTESRPAFFLGACVAAVGTGVHLFYSEGGPQHERYDTVIGIYITAITAILGLKAFYDRLIPITDVNVLLKKVTADLKQCKEGDLWIVYPALNIGYYRNHIKCKHRVSSSVVDDFSAALADCAERVKDGAHAVTYDKERIKELYSTYVTSQSNGAASDVGESIKACVDNADEMRKALIRRAGKGKGENDLDGYLRSSGHLHHHAMNPDRFPPHTIVIGAVTYTLVSYGLPIYEPDEKFGKFTLVRGEHKLVDIVAYRREDTALAHLISQHLAQLTIPNAVAPSNEGSSGVERP